MNLIEFNLFSNGKRKAVTFSYDDGHICDERLVDLFDKKGVKCTFNLNACLIGQKGYISSSFVRNISERHEIACHSYSHPVLKNQPISRIISELYEDKVALEEIVGRPVCGMAYPYGSYDENVKNALRASGILYSRTTERNTSFTFPSDFLEWHPNCHHNVAIERAKEFVEINGNMSLLYIWGHSHEFENQHNWNVMEELLHILAGRNDIWYATNIELYDYKKSVQSLRVSLNGKSVYNPSAITVYATVNGKPTAFEPGLTVL